MIKKNRFTLSAPVLAVLLASCVMLFTLFFSQGIGMADSGNFSRVLNNSGLSYLSDEAFEQSAGYFNPQYGAMTYYNELRDGLFSAQLPLIRAGMALDSALTGSDGLFDIRCLAFVLCLWLLAVLYALVSWASFGRTRREGVGIAALAVFLFTDTAYLVYFNSFYTEGLVLVSLLGCFATALLLEQGRERPYFLLCCYSANALALICIQPQTATLGPLLGVLGAVAAFRHWRRQRAQAAGVLLPNATARVEQSVIDSRVAAHAAPSEAHGYAAVRFAKSAQARPTVARSQPLFLRIACGLCGTLALVGICLSVLALQQPFYNDKYHTMTRGILLSAQDPEATLTSFGIDPQYALLDGSMYFEPYHPVDVNGARLRNDLYQHYNGFSVVLYYLSHPAQLLQMIERSTQNAYTARPAAVGNFQRGAGHAPSTLSYRFALVSSLKAAFVPRGGAFLLLWAVAVLALSFRKRGRTLVLAAAILIGVSQLIAAILSAGDANLTQHIFLYYVCFDFVNYALLSSLVLPAAVRLYTRHKAQRAARAPQAEKGAIAV